MLILFQVIVSAAYLKEITQLTCNLNFPLNTTCTISHMMLSSESPVIDILHSTYMVGLVLLWGKVFCIFLFLSSLNMLYPSSIVIVTTATDYLIKGITFIPNALFV